MDEGKRQKRPRRSFNDDFKARAVRRRSPIMVGRQGRVVSNK